MNSFILIHSHMIGLEVEYFDTLEEAQVQAVAGDTIAKVIEDIE